MSEIFKSIKGATLKASHRKGSNSKGANDPKASNDPKTPNNPKCANDKATDHKEPERKGANLKGNKKAGHSIGAREEAKARQGAKLRHNARSSRPEAKSRTSARSRTDATSTRARRDAIARSHAELGEEPSVPLPKGYRPSEDEPFMNERQRAYFRQKLLRWREEIINETRETLQHLHDDTTKLADLADRATTETDRAIELRARDRQRKLIAKIDAALGRIRDGSYGYCEETGEPISLKRLDARPIATLSLEAQERHERRERVYRDD